MYHASKETGTGLGQESKPRSSSMRTLDEERRIIELQEFAGDFLLDLLGQKASKNNVRPDVSWLGKDASEIIQIEEAVVGLESIFDNFTCNTCKAFSGSVRGFAKAHHSFIVEVATSLCDHIIGYVGYIPETCPGIIHQ